jgi:hypothetical protein
MARIIKMPPLEELPDGPRREFVEELRRYYRAAGRPPLRQVSRNIEGRQDLKEVTASQETVRRVLRGMVIPTDWNRVNAIFQVFCEEGGIDPEDGLWDRALEEEPDIAPMPRPTPPRPEPSRAATDDPWASEVGNGGLSDEPPF